MVFFFEAYLGVLASHSNNYIKGLLTHGEMKKKPIPRAMPEHLSDTASTFRAGRRSRGSLLTCYQLSLPFACADTSRRTNKLPEREEMEFP